MAASDARHIEEVTTSAAKHGGIIFRYGMTAGILAILTLLEIFILYPPMEHWDTVWRVAFLGVLGVAKFILVVALFMHLWDDPPLYTILFSIGMFMATGTIGALLLLMPPNSEPLTHDSPEYQEYHELLQSSGHHAEKAPATAH